ncbi:sulfatase-like hydrolase/transferase [Fulvimonas sp. R45]|uniref:sulfatase-like hydrolase/transferase n=1 Tax=Fulvimonas sp. R45 TaxID=3045937 RepID=UPI00266043EB|nr:sulfatase-like hydrolase/transferase [Fulvimonas sp. R45]MDO1529232.1 sulfatase-like hydrolase/transferase [Fulvimonas sp. R45]
MRQPFRLTRRRATLVAALLFFAACAWLTAWREPLPEQRGFVFALMLCVAGAGLCAFARAAFALVLGGGLFLLLRAITVMKQEYLESPLMPADFVYYVRSSLFETLRRYPHIYSVGLAVAVAVPLLLWLAWRGSRPLFAHWRRWPRAALRLGGFAVFALAFWICLLPSGPFARVHARDAWDKMSDDAVLTDFFVNLRDSSVHLPPMADAAIAERDWQATATAAPGGVPAAQYPDIVQVLEESTFDPAPYAHCDVPACHAAMFLPDARTRGHGVLRTHTFGGGTWVSEFASLTGLPQDIFGPGGMYAPYVLAPRMRDSLPLLLKRLGYLTVAVYPTHGDFLNGEDAYKAYGIDRFYGAGELGLDDWEETDAQMFAAAERVYAELDRSGARKPGQPVFLVVLTINEHGPHDDPMNTLPKPFQNLLHGLPADAALNFDTYLSRLHDSDVAMQGLEHAFLDRARPTVLVHFGDHQPSFDSLMPTLRRELPPALAPYRDYLTYYMIKSNVPGPALPAYPMLDIAYLPGLVLQAAGLPLDPYFAAQKALRERCDGRYDDCADKALLASYHAWIFGRLHVFE